MPTYFNEIYEDHPGISLKVANGEPMHSHAVGNVKLKLERADGTFSEILIHNVVYHPSFSHNLLSVRRLWKDNGLRTKFGKTNSFTDRKNNERYYFQFNDQFQVESVKSVSTSTCLSAASVSARGLLGNRGPPCKNRRLASVPAVALSVGNSWRELVISPVRPLPRSGLRQ